MLAPSVTLLVILFATTFYVMGLIDPNSFSETVTRLDAFYFTITVLATIGFGDIVARIEQARAIVTVQTVVNLLVIGIGLRLILGAVHEARNSSRP